MRELRPADRQGSAAGVPAGHARRRLQAARGTALNERWSHVRPLLLVAAVVYVIDQVTKVVANAQLSKTDPVEIVPVVLQLRLVHNPGAAFGLGGSATFVFALIALAVVGVIIRTARTLRSRWWAIALGLLLGGATGNLTDRILREPGFLRGRVVDFLELPNWPVFNVADMAIMGAAGAIAVLTLRGVAPDGTRVTADDAEAQLASEQEEVERAVLAEDPADTDQSADRTNDEGGQRG